jgi:hypothetical protein
MREICISTYLNDRIEQHKNSIKKYVKIILIGTILAVPVYLYVPNLIFLYFVFLGFMSFKINKHHSAIKIFRAGLQGETALKQTLNSLSDDFVAFYNVPINNSKDIDCVLVGPKGVFIIEVKNHKGTIIYSENGWKQLKTGRGGTQYLGNLENPRKQLLANMHKFKTFLDENNIHVWIQPILVFTNPEADIVLEKEPKPIIVCKIENILDVINNSGKTILQELINRICDLLQNSVKIESTKL